jgi:hypothetical protein
MSIGSHRRNTLSRFLRNAVALAAGGVVAQVALIIVEVIIARDLGAAAYGVFATTYAFVTLAIIFQKYRRSIRYERNEVRSVATCPTRA